MRKTRLDQSGDLHCRKCGSAWFLAQVEEATARTKHLKCSVCGKRQRFREPKRRGGNSRTSAVEEPDPS